MNLYPSVKYRFSPPFQATLVLLEEGVFDNKLEIALWKAKSSKRPIFNLKNLANDEIIFWWNMISLQIGTLTLHYRNILT